MYAARYVKITPFTEVFIAWNHPMWDQGGMEYQTEEMGGVIERELWLGKLYISASTKLSNTILN